MAQRQVQRSQTVVPCVKLINVGVLPKYKCGCPSCPEKFDSYIDKVDHEDTHDPRDLICIICGLLEQEGCMCDPDGFVNESWKV